MGKMHQKKSPNLQWTNVVLQDMLQISGTSSTSVIQNQFILLIQKSNQGVGAAKNPEKWRVFLKAKTFRSLLITWVLNHQVNDFRNH